MSIEQELSRRLHHLVDQVPAGRNLAPEIRRAHARRRVRVAAVGTSLGVTGAVSVGAFAFATHPSSDGGVGTAPAASGSPFVAVTLPHAVATVGADDVATVRSAPYWFQRTISIGEGHTFERQAWTGRRTSGYLEQAMPPDFTVKRLPMGVGTFEGENQQVVTWDEFSSVPSPAELQRLVYGTRPSTPSERLKNGFAQGQELLSETPTTQGFRLAVFDALKKVPGVVVTTGVRDAVGRVGVQLARDDLRLVIDPSDGRLLQVDDLGGTCPGGVPNVEWRGVLLESGPMSSDEAAPPAVPVTLSDAGMGCAGGVAPSGLQESAAAATSG